MLTKLKALREEREDGFTLIELLVVILIIGILAAIAIPVFLNQRQTANDGAVKSDVRNAALLVETILIDNSNGAFVRSNLSGTVATGATLTVCVVPLSTTVTCPVGSESTKLSPGVNITTVSTSTPNAYTLQGFHTNGKKYKSTTQLSYDSANGGLQA